MKGTSGPLWEVCVFSGAGDYADLKNALLYADHVNWVSTELLLSLSTALWQQQQIKAGLRTDFTSVNAPAVLVEITRAQCDGFITPAFGDLKTEMTRSKTGGWK